MDTNIFIGLLIDEENSSEYDKMCGSAENIKLTRKTKDQYINCDDKILFIKEDKDLFSIVL